MRRRAYLGLLGVGLLAGCLGGDSGDGDNGDDSTDGTGDDTDSAGDDGGTDDGGTDDGGTDDDGTDDGGTDDGTEEDSPADPSSVQFQLHWRESFDYQGTISGENYGADATADGVFLGGEWGFAALNLDDGSRMWEIDEFDGFVDIHADSDGVVAYTQSFDVVSFAPSDGTEQWRASTTGAENAFFNTALTPSYFIAESADRTVVFDRSSGDVATEIDASPSVATDDILVSITFQEMVAYDIASGSERWRTDSGLSRGPVVNDGRLVGIEVTPGPQSGGSLMALDLDSGDEVWAEEIADLKTPVSSVAVTDGVATFMSRPSTDPGTLYAHDFADGTQLWSQGVGNVPIASFSLATDSGIVIAPGVTDDNRVQVRAYDAQNGEQLDATSGGLGITEAVAVDRVLLEIDLADVTATTF
jgi:hypothetical protein